MSRNKQYAMVLDKNTGVYYGAEIDVVLIDSVGDALIKIKGDNKLLTIKASNIFDDMYTLYLKLQLANKD